MINYTVILKYKVSPIKVQSTMTDLLVDTPYLMIKNLLSTLNDTQLSNLVSIEILSGVNSKFKSGYRFFMDLKSKTLY